MRVRPAEFSDIPRLLAIERQSQSAAHWGERDYHALFPATPKDEGSVPRRICLVVESAPETGDSSPDSLVAGFVVALCLDPEWEIENIVVDPTLRRRGCATLLLRELLSRASHEGAETIFLEVRESNHSARSFYARLEFQVFGRRRNYYRDPEEDAILLHLRCTDF